MLENLTTVAWYEEYIDDNDQVCFYHYPLHKSDIQFDLVINELEHGP